jgi:hypothetical protein
MGLYVVRGARTSDFGRRCPSTAWAGSDAFPRRTGCCIRRSHACLPMRGGGVCLFGLAPRAGRGVSNVPLYCAGGGITAVLVLLQRVAL